MSRRERRITRPPRPPHAGRPGIAYLARPEGFRDLVLVAPGGMADSLNASTGWGPGALRLLPLAAAASRAAPDAAVGMLRYRLRGWNGQSQDAATDLRTVLAALPPTVERVLLIGHSMGGRAVVAAAGDPRVRGVCALAPWLPTGEPLGGLIATPPGNAVLVVLAHGSADTWTDPRATADFARRCRERGRPVASFVVPGERHDLLGRAALWEDLVRRFVTTALTGAADPVLDAAVSADPGRPPDALGAGRRSPLRGGASVLASAPVLLRLLRARRR